MRCKNSSLRYYAFISASKRSSKMHKIFQFRIFCYFKNIFVYL